MKKALLLIALMLISVPLKAMTEISDSDTAPCHRIKAAGEEAHRPASSASGRPYRYDRNHETSLLI